jgi:signal transduction histidine kinase
MLRSVFYDACMKSLAAVGMCLALALTLCAQPEGPAPILLTNVEQVVMLPSTALASNRYEAKVQGVVTYVSTASSRIYVQDGEKSLMATLNSVREFQMGQRVEVTGSVIGALPFPGITDGKATVLGEASLPDAPFFPAQQLAAGEQAFRHITTRGVVRDMNSSKNGLLLLLTHEGAAFELAVATPAPISREWLDAEIEVTGKSYPFFNSRGRPINFRFHTATTNFIRVLKPGSGKLFDRPLMTIAEAAKQPQEWQPRYRISGTVTLHKPGVLYLDDGTGVMLVLPMGLLPKPLNGETLTHDPQTILHPGEKVEVIGVRRNWHSLTPTMIFAEYRRVGEGPLPTPVPVKVSDLVAGRNAGRVVSIEGRILNQRAWNTSSGAHNQLVTLQAGEDVVEANWTSEIPAEWKMKPDTYVRVTGVHESEGGQVKSRPTFQILMRSPSDITPASAPAFWKQAKVWKPSLAAGVVGALAAGWILMLRRQVRRRTEQLQSTNSELQDEVNDRKRAELVQRAIYQISEAVRSEQDLKSFYARIHEVVRSLMPAANFFLLLYNEEMDRHEYVYHVDQVDPWPAPRKVTAGLVGYILRTGRALLVDRESMTNAQNDWHSVSGTPSAVWLGVPLKVHGEIVGVMAVQDYQNPKAYGDDEKKILIYMAEQTGLALERKHSDAALEESQARLRESLIDVARALDQERELSQLKSSFVTMVSHEFRTPLEVILSSSNILDRYLERLPAEKRKAQLRAIRKAVHRMNDLIEDVLLLGKLEGGRLTCQPTPIDLMAFCRRSIDEIESAAGREGTIRLAISDLNGEVSGDEGLLHHILANLLSNALKYSPGEQSVDLTVAKHGPDAEFVIRDRGCGIPIADRARLFTAFSRGSNVAQTRGTGLGLAIVKRCVDLHGGSIRCDSEEGKGTAFVVSLPLFDETRRFRRKPSTESLLS